MKTSGDVSKTAGFFLDKRDDGFDLGHKIVHDGQCRVSFRPLDFAKRYGESELECALNCAPGPRVRSSISFFVLSQMWGVGILKYLCR